MGSPLIALIVEHDANAANEMRLVLENHGFTVSVARTAKETVTYIKSDMSFSVILLSDVLPDGDGYSLCSEIRGEHAFKGAVIMVGCASHQENIVLGLDVGADDYVSKPFTGVILGARLRANLGSRRRGWENTQQVSFAIGSWDLRPSVSMLVDSRTGRRKRLTSKEVTMLRRLMDAQGQPVGRNDLIQVVWGADTEICGHTLETHVYRLRQKLEANPGTPELLHTAAGGYRLSRHPERQAAQSYDRNVRMAA